VEVVLVLPLWVAAVLPPLLLLADTAAVGLVPDASAAAEPRRRTEELLGPAAEDESAE
jgi:hypothetical protein